MSLSLIVEGEGDRAAVPILVAKLALADGIVGLPHIGHGGVAKIQLHLAAANGQDRLERRVEAYRNREGVSALLVTQDSEDTCPKYHAPEVAEWIRPLNLPIPVAVVLFYREYETLFLAGSAGLQGQPLPGIADSAGLPGGAVFDADPELPRDAKGWIKAMRGRYVETIHQAPFTRVLDIRDERLRRLSSFRRLRSGLAFLAQHAGSAGRGRVYP